MKLNGPTIGGFDSPFCGYSVNNDYSEHWTLGGELKNGTEAAITEAMLRENPFFRLSLDDDFSLSELVDPNVANVNAFLRNNISDTYLKDYYTENTDVHPHVTVKDFLLAEAFPATTLPMGANKCEHPKVLKNIDMSDTIAKGGCKANEGSWPRGDGYIDGNGDWWHSDYKDLPYVFVYPFYEKIINEIK